ncbi:Carbonic anhydrase [Minicystis rosea]|nr:Carbonic anhydrase [Minicystis rosea]
MNDRRKPLLTLRLDIGIRALRPVWRAAYDRTTWRADALAALSAIGPSFALALLAAQHAGLPATTVLICVVVGSAVVALLGGTTLGLSGPGLAMGFSLVHIAREHGAAGLALAAAICGVLQLVLGMLGLGRFARLVPLTAVHAFVFGLGALLVIQSLPHVLGLATPVDLDTLHVVDHIHARLGGARWAAIAMGVFTCAVTLLGARHTPRVPVALTSVAACAGITALAHLDVPTLPDMPFALPSLSAAAVPAQDVAQFVRAALVLFLLATMETLLSMSAEEERVPGTRDDPDQELIGHGVANLVLSLLGSVPAAGSIVRASRLRATGGRTRAAALIHALMGLALVPLLLRFDRFVPLAAIAGVVIGLSVPLLDLRAFHAVLRVSRAEAIVLGATTFVIIFGNLLQGIETGLVATLVLAMMNVARFRATLHRGRDGAPHQASLSGPITFLSVPRLEAMRAQLAALDPAVGVILDIRSVLVMDFTGSERFTSLVAEVVARGGKVAVLGASPSCREKLLAADEQGVLANRLAVSDRDVDAILEQERAFGMRAHVIANLERFRHEVREHYTPLFDQLADGQHPHTLFVTCVDSRIAPSMLTGAHPGELFILRCLGAMVEPPGDDALPAEGAAVEYAVGVLGVRNIVVCGHSSCGAVKAIKSKHVPDELTSLRQWLSAIPAASGDLSHHHDVDDAARAVTVRQLDNLRQFPLVRERIDKGELELHAWFYDVRQTELFEWDEAKQDFIVFGGHNLSMPPPEMKAS